ncbi:MAG: MG2 domain-containing protein [Acidobacteriota bacterium]
MILAMCLTAWILAASPGFAQKPSSAPSRPDGVRGTAVVPEDFLRRFDPITVFFSRPVGPAEGGPVAADDDVFRLEPRHPGEAIWLDATTLQFRPVDPWPALGRFTVTAGKVRRSLLTLMARPSSTTPEAQSRGVSSLSDITLAFAEPVDPDALARSLQLELRRLPGVESRGAVWLDREDFEVKVVERQKRSDPARYVLSFDRPLPEGHRVLVHQRLSVAPIAGKPSGQVVVLDVTTAEPFRVTAFGCPRSTYPVTAAGVVYGAEQAIRCDGDLAARLEFSAAAQALTPVDCRNLVRLTPSVDRLSCQTSGSGVTISGGFERERTYRLALGRADIKDPRGRRLTASGPSEVHLYFPAKVPYLGLRSGAGLVERTGPQSVPMEGRGDRRVDVRIHRLDDLDRSFWPFPAAPVAVDESRRPPGPGEAPAPFGELWRTPTPGELAGQLRALGSPTVSRFVDLPLSRSAARFGLDLAPLLDDGFGVDAPGSYLVGVRRLDGSTRRQWMRIQSSDLALTTFEEPRRVVFAVTSIASGAPVAGASVRVEGARRTSAGEAWETLFDGRTDGRGLLTWEPPGYRRGVSVNVGRMVVESRGDRLVIDPAKPRQRFADGAFLEDSSTWLQWTHRETMANRGARPESLGHLFTERPVYRPEDPVHVVGYLRLRRAGRLTPVVEPGFLVIDGPGGRTWREAVTPTPSGAFYHRFEVDDAATGVYRASFETKGSGTRLGSVTFRKEAYRLPRFEVLLSGPEGGGPATLDRTFDVQATATYYAGGRVAQRPLRWRVTQFPYRHRPKPRPGFVYASDGRYSDTGAFESTPALDVETTTDDDGGATLTLDPSIEPTAQPRTYVVEATITGADDQTVTATRRVVALPPFVLGLKAPRFLEPGAALAPEVLVLGADDEPLAGQSVTVRLLHRQWHSHLRASDFSDGVARYVTDVVDEAVAEVEIESGAEPVAVPIDIGEPGVYVVELVSRDRLGRTQVVAVDLYAASGGEEPVSWERPSTQVFSVSSDRSSYRPGDTARLVFKSPFQEARAMVVVEAPEGNRYRWVTVRGGEGVFELPIEGTWTPRLPVHVVLIRGRLDGTEPRPGNMTDLGRPQLLASTTWLDVDPVDLRLRVELEHAAESMPGRPLDVTVRLATPDGSPAAGEVTLWLVDRAVLALGKEQRLDPVPDFVTPVSSWLAVRDTRGAIFGDLPFAELPGGGEGAEERGVLDRQTVRKNFNPVPFFESGLEVGPDGELTVQVQLPDDLTDFAVRAKALSGPERFGAAKSRLSVRLPVIVQPALPRFVRPGDRFEAAAVGRVVSGDGGPAAVQVRLDGLELLDGGADLERELVLSPVDPERIAFDVTVPTPPSAADPWGEDGAPAGGTVGVQVGMERLADRAGDAFAVELPIVEDRRPVVERQIVALEPGESFAWPAVTDEVRPGSLSREVLAASRPALVRMAAGLDALLDYPFGCTEQRLSKARVQLALGRFRDVLVLPPQGHTARAVVETLEWLEQSTAPNGLVAYWPGGAGYVSLTAWAGHFLAEAEQAGYEVPTALRASIERSLEQALRSDYAHFVSGADWSERVMALETLGRLGRFDSAYAAELGRNASYLGAEDVARLLLALDDGDASDDRPALLDRLWTSVIFQLRGGEEVYAGLQAKGLGNPLILPSETRTLASMTRALARLAREDRRFETLVDALVRLGRGDGWGSTQADAAALLALSELFEPGSETLPERTLEVAWPDGPESLRVGGGAPSALSRRSADGAVELRALGDATAPPVVVRAETRYLPAGDGSTVESARSGFVVERRWLVRDEEPPRRLEIDGPAELGLSIGDVVEEHIRVVNSEERHFVAVVVPLAAGVEALNPHLATAPPEARPDGALTLEPTYADFRDDHVAFYFDTLPAGTFDFYFRARASVVGSFAQPPAQAEMMYDLAVFGRSAGARVEVFRP